MRESGETELLSSHGVPLGLLPGQSYSSGSLTMRPGDLLVLYTDGYTEASNAEEEEFGLDRLVAAAREARGMPVAEAQAHIDAAVSAFVGTEPFADDRTLVLLRRV